MLPKSKFVWIIAVCVAVGGIHLGLMGAGCGGGGGACDPAKGGTDCGLGSDVCDAVTKTCVTPKDCAAATDCEGGYKCGILTKKCLKSCGVPGDEDLVSCKSGFTCSANRECVAASMGAGDMAMKPAADMAMEQAAPDMNVVGLDCDVTNKNTCGGNYYLCSSVTNKCVEQPACTKDQDCADGFICDGTNCQVNCWNQKNGEVWQIKCQMGYTCTGQGVCTK